MVDIWAGVDVYGRDGGDGGGGREAREGETRRRESEGQQVEYKEDEAGG